MATRALARPHAGRLPLLVVAALLAGAILTLVVMRQVVAEVAGLYPADLPENPYLVVEHAALLYFVAPFVFLLSCGLFLAPGMLITLALDRPRGLCDWLLRGFGASYLLFAINGVLHKWLTGMHLELHHLIGMLCVLTTIGLAVVTWRSNRVRPLLTAFCSRHDLRRIGWVLILPWLALILLLPLVFWQDFNGDGAEAFVLGQRLHAAISQQPLSIASGMIAPTVLVNWFLSIFQSPEPSARFPVFLLLPLLFAGIVALSEVRTGSRLHFAQEGILGLGVAGFLIAIGLNASYEPYSADLASPGCHEFLFVHAVVAMLYFFWRRETFWFLAYALLASFTRLTALLILVLLGLAVCLFYRRNRLPRMARIAAVLAACLLAALFWEMEQGSGLASGNGSFLSTVAQRMRHVSWSHWHNFLYLAIPGGLVPLLVFALVRRHDRMGRSLILITIAFFALFHLKAFVNLHHFAPAMLLPLAVLGRLLASGRALAGRALVPVYVIMLVVLFASLPRSFAVHRSERTIGQRVSCLLPECESMDSRLARPMLYLNLLFRPRWKVQDPSSERVLSPLVLALYMRGPSEPVWEANYVVQLSNQPPPPGFEVIGSKRRVAVLVRDRTLWMRDRFGNFRTDFRSPLYAAPPETIFQFLGVPAKEYDLDLVEVFKGGAAFLP